MGRQEQQTAVYDAQYRAEDALPAEVRGRAFTDEAELQAYVDELREKEFWQDYPDVLRIEVHARKQGGAVADTKLVDGCGYIECGPDKMYARPVLHEVAHVLAMARYGSTSHDPWWARTYLELVYDNLGSAAYKALYDAFAEGGVQTFQPPTRPGQIAL